jgi:hypothetical protein
VSLPLEKLKAATRIECERLYTERWGGPLDLPSIDYSDALANWKRTRPVEEKAAKVLAAVRSKIDAARDLTANLGPFDGGENVAKLRAMLDTLDRSTDDGEAEHVPMARPGIRAWMLEYRIESRYPNATVRDLSVLSILAGLWPPRMAAGKAEGVLTEQDRSVRAALKSLDTLRHSKIR